MVLKLELITPEFFDRPQVGATRPIKILIETGRELEIKYLRYNTEKMNWRIASNDNCPSGTILRGPNRMSAKYKGSNFYKIIEGEEH